jgi:hypothetical protein
MSDNGVVNYFRVVRGVRVLRTVRGGPGQSARAQASPWGRCYNTCQLERDGVQPQLCKKSQCKPWFTRSQRRTCGGSGECLPMLVQHRHSTVLA